MNIYGDETLKAQKNFINSGLPIHRNLIVAYSQIKLACAQTNIELDYLDKLKGDAICEACKQIIIGQFHEQIVVDPLQGGAGTSFNMNINELISSLASKTTNQLVHPIEDVNMHQSTNDTYGTALKIAIYTYLIELENSLNDLLVTLQAKEQDFSGIVKMGRTQLMPAVPCTLGQEFSAYSEMIGRDRWRIFKSQERIRQINLGGTAIGTGITAPKKYIPLVNDKLRNITGLPIARAENLFDATQNNDQLAEVMGMIKVVALNLEKMSKDLRYLNSIGEITVDELQKGSTVMPGKTNPVILEMISSISKKVIGNDLTVSLAIKDGELELNAFIPLAGYCTLESLDILIQGINKLNKLCIQPLQANKKACYELLVYAPTVTTILVTKIGYIEAEKLATYMKENHVDIYGASKTLNISDKETIDELLKPERILSLGESFDSPKDK